MADPRQPVLRNILQGCSRLLLIAGAIVFLCGDKFLYEIKHVSFFESEGAGILGGVLLMALGAGIGAASKTRKPEQHRDRDHAKL